MSIEEDLRKSMGENFEERLASKVREFHGLILRESALQLLSLEAQGSAPRPESIAQASRSLRPSLLRVRVERIFPARSFERNGSISKSQRVSVSDQSGPGTLVIYDSACEPLERCLLSGDLFEAGPVRFRGGEFHLLPGGTLARLQKGARLKIKQENNASAHSTPRPASAIRSTSTSLVPPIGHFEGTVSDFFGDFPYRKGQAKLSGDAPSSLMSSFELTDASGRARVVLWDSPGLAHVLKIGQQVEIENGQLRGGEIHISANGRLVMNVMEGKARPKIEKMGVEEKAGMEGKEGAFVFVVHSSGSPSIIFHSLEEAAARLGAGPVPQGVDARTVLELKGREWIGKPMPAEWEKFARL